MQRRKANTISSEPGLPSTNQPLTLPFGSRISVQERQIINAWLGEPEERVSEQIPNLNYADLSY
jgi:hypothetical protein